MITDIGDDKKKFRETEIGGFGQMREKENKKKVRDFIKFCK